MTNIKDRVLQFAENQEGNKQIFFRKTGLKYSNFTGKSKESDLGSEFIGKILATYPQIDLHWLITGRRKYEPEEQEPLRVVNEPPIEMDYKERYHDCTEKYMKLNEELRELRAINANLKKSNQQISDKQ